MLALLRRLLTIIVLIGVVYGLEASFEQIIPDAAWRQLALYAMVNVVAALSLNVINGMAGQFSIGHAGFVGIGAYTAAVVSANIHQRLGNEEILFGNSFAVVPPSLVAAGLAAAVFGLVVGLPSLRLRGDYLAIVTLGFAEIFRLVIATAQTGGGEEGLIARGLASLGGQNGYAGPDGTGLPQYAGPFWVFGTVIVAVVICWRLKFSGWGRTLRALREDEIAAASVGVDPTRYKVVSFVIAAAGAGVAGGLLASMRDGVPTVQPDQFGFNYSFELITMVILGGSGSVTGAIVGGVFVTFTVKLIEYFQPAFHGYFQSLAGGIEPWSPTIAEHLKSPDLNALRMVVYAAILIGLMILRPEGIFGERELFRRSRKKSAAAPAGVGSAAGTADLGSPVAPTKAEATAARGDAADEPAPEAADEPRDQTRLD